MIIKNTKEISKEYIDKFDECDKCHSKPVIEVYFDDISGEKNSYICCPNCEDKRVIFNKHLEYIYPIWNEKNETDFQKFISDCYSENSNWLKEQIADVVTYYQNWSIKYKDDLIYVYDENNKLWFTFSNYEEFKNVVWNEIE